MMWLHRVWRAWLMVYIDTPEYYGLERRQRAVRPRSVNERRQDMRLQLWAKGRLEELELRAETRRHASG